MNQKLSQVSQVQEGLKIAHKLLTAKGLGGEVMILTCGESVSGMEGMERTLSKLSSSNFFPDDADILRKFWFQIMQIS